MVQGGICRVSLPPSTTQEEHIININPLPVSLLGMLSYVTRITLLSVLVRNVHIRRPCSHPVSDSETGENTRLDVPKA